MAVAVSVVVVVVVVVVIVVRLTEDRKACRERSCAAGAANVITDDAD